MSRPALFLDRDGIINVDINYAHLPEQIVFVDGIFDVMREAKRQGYLLFIITNQAGIGRGYYTEEQFHDLMKWMQQRFVEEGASVEGYYYCPHHPKHAEGEYLKTCDCRKPQPGMLLRTIQEHDIDASRSIMIGDRHTDMEAAQAAKIGQLWQLDINGMETHHADARVASSHRQILEWLRKT